MIHQLIEPDLIIQFGCQVNLVWFAINQFHLLLHIDNLDRVEVLENFKDKSGFTSGVLLAGIDYLKWRTTNT